MYIVNGISYVDEAVGREVEGYLAKGFDLKSAEYFAGGRKRIEAVSTNDDFTLRLSFAGDEIRIFDCKPMLAKDGVFSKFENLDDFRRVYLDEDHCVSWDIDPAVDSAVVWTNKVDLSQDTCYLESSPILA